MTTETHEGRSAEAGERPESGFEINGERYHIPRLDTITLDEERIMFVYADAVLQDFAPPHPGSSAEEKEAYEVVQTRKIRNPEFKRALAHIAYRREHPEVSDADIQASIGLASALELDIALLRGDDEDPPDLSSQQPLESERSFKPLSRSSDSGSPTANDSAPVVVLPDRTGITESETSSPGAVPIGSVS